MEDSIERHWLCLIPDDCSTLRKTSPSRKFSRQDEAVWAADLGVIVGQRLGAQADHLQLSQDQPDVPVGPCCHRLKGCLVYGQALGLADGHSSLCNLVAGRLPVPNGCTLTPRFQSGSDTNLGYDGW